MIPRGLRIYLALEPTDMRRSVRGLSRVVRERFGEEAAATRALYVFVNKRRDRAKVLWRSEPGWTVLYRVLDGRRLVIPVANEGRVVLNAAKLAELLAGVARRETAREVARAARKEVR